MKRYFSACFLALLVGLLAVQSLQSFGQDSWTQKRDFGDLVSGTDATARYGAVAFSINGKGYMGTGSSSAGRSTDFYEYDPNTNVWTKMDDFPGTARFYSVGFSIGNKGYVGTGDDGHGTNDFYEFDPTKGSTFQWTKIADFPAVARFGAVGFSIGAKGYVGTGHLFGTIGEPLYRINDFWELDITYINPTTLVKGKWTQKKNVGGVERAYAVGFSIGSKGYIGTGNTAGGKVNDFWEYNPVNDTWTEKQRFGNATGAYDYGKQRFSAVAFSIGSLGYIGTGDIGGSLSYMSDFWEYDPTQGILGRWTKKLSLSDSVNTSPAAFSIGNKGYIGTGYYHRPSVLGKEFWEYTPSCTPPDAPSIISVTQPDCIIQTGNVELGGLPTGAWKITINYPGGDSLKSSGETATISGLGSGSAPITYTARVSNSSGCTSPASVPFTINVNPAATSLGTISGLTDVCSGVSKVYSVPDVPGFTDYNWSVSGTGWVITSVQGTTSATITIGTGPGTVTVSATNSCSGTAQSTLNIIPGTSIPPTPGSISGSVAHCDGVKMDYEITPVAGATSYTWSTTGTDWYIYGELGKTKSTIAFGVAAEVGTVTVKANNGCGSSAVSILNITPIPLPLISLEPANKTIAFNATDSLTIGITHVALSYQWQENQGTGYVNISDGGKYSGTTTATLKISLPTLAMSGYKYRCVVSGACSPQTATSNGNATLTVPLTWAGTSGANGTSWDLPTNWIPNFVPQDNYDVFIANTTYKPIINNSAVCKNLTINSGAIVSIAAGSSLTVNGILTNKNGNAGLVIKSNASGTGSLIHSTANVPSTIERYIAGDWTAANSGWHFISSPVVNQAISVFATTGAGNGYDFYGWNEPANLWVNYKAGAFVAWNGVSNFNIGQGYMISYQVNQTKIFTGNITVGNVTKTNLTRTAGGSNYSWHLLGNPFSSAIKWNDGNWALTNVAGEAKIWNGAAKSYTDIAANGIIPSAQGFMISVNQSSNSITIPAASRTHNTAFYKSSEEPRILLVASEKDGNSFQESQILINPSATAGFDFEYDSRFLAGYAPQFYSVIDNEMLSTNSVPSISGIESIHFNFVKNQSDTYNIQLKENIGTQAVYLMDLQTDSIQNLNANPIYDFTSAEGDNPARFILHFLDFTKVPESINQEIFTLEQSNGNITIITLKSVSAEIAVSNMLGQVVLQSKTNGNTSTLLSAGKLPNGVYIVSLTSDKMVASKKIVINK